MYEPDEFLEADYESRNGANVDLEEGYLDIDQEDEDQ